MLFKLFTSPAGTNHVSHWAKVTVTALTLSLCLGACTSKPAADNNQQQEAEASPLIVDKDQTIADASIKESSGHSQPTPAINLYLQQQAEQTTAVPADVLKYYQQAISLMKAKKWQQAQALFDQVILKQPQLSGSYVNKAIIAKQKGQLNQAQVLLNKAIAANNLNLYAHHLQGQVYRLQGQFDKAEKSYLAAIAIWPDFAEVHASMAILLELYRGRLLDAHGYYRSYLALNSDDQEVKRWQAGLEIKIKRAGLEVPTLELAEPQVIKAQPVEQESNDGQVSDKQTGSINNALESNHG